MLTASGVTKRFGGLTAVDTVDLNIDRGEIVGLIGPNGAGKTTLFNSIAGVHVPEEGSITFDGVELVGKGPHEIAQSGITRTFQTARTFNESTVIDNVLAGAMFGKRDPGSLREERENVREYLQFIGLEDKADEDASSLTIAHRKQLELARALATEPSLILVDEIGSGLTPAEITELSENLQRTRDEFGISIFWIEHVMDAIMNSTDRIIVLNQGRKIASGTPKEIQQNQQVAEAYLGGRRRNMITVDNLDIHYGDLQVLWDLSLEIRDDDSIVAIVGPNGAGKTTLLKTLSGVITPTNGHIELFGTDASELSPSEIVKEGFVHVSEKRNLFEDLTVYENLRMGAYTERDEFEETYEEVTEMFPVLEDRREQKAGTLSGGEQQMLAIGRGLMAQPKVLALDEPSGALAPQLAQRVFEKIEEISDDVTVILIEQHVDQALELANRAYLLENGRMATEGTGAELLESDHVKESYLSG